MSEDDLRIIKAIKFFYDDEALRLLYKRSLPKIQKLAKKFKASREDGEDVFQDAVIALFKIVRSDSIEKNIEIDAFLYVVCKNLLIKRYNKDQKFTIENISDVVISDKDEQILERILDKERNDKLNLVLDKLNEGCKSLLTLIYFQQKSMIEICEKLGFKSPDVAKSTHYRCKKKLLEYIENDATLFEILNEKRY